MSIQPIPAPNAWRVADMLATSRWKIHLTQEDLGAIDRALAFVKQHGLRIPFGPEAFPLGDFAARMASIRSELETGTGVMLMRGLEVARYGLDDARLIYWGLGAHLGPALAQTPKGDLLIDVRNEGGDPYRDPTKRGYYTTQYLPFHNDQGDVVGLMCVRPAKSGGLSCICSAAAIHNEILRSRPDLLEVLYGPFYADIRGEQPPGRAPFYMEPRYAQFDGRFYAQHGPTYIRSAQRFPEVPRLTHEQNEAMDLIDMLAASDEFRLDMDFRPGDIQFLNNHLVLHSRTGFEDFDSAEARRHLLRLWVCTPGYSKIPPFFQTRFDDMKFWLEHPVSA
ncbi:MAG: TauD/TfdA family dioxygenase [Janthinobacterium lividum]